MKLFELKDPKIVEGKDMSALPSTVIKDIEKKIREGAKDTSQKWKNALELVQKAYEVLNIERPTPASPAAWSQYEDMISFAVNELAKARGVNGDWRYTFPENS